MLNPITILTVVTNYYEDLEVQTHIVRSVRGRSYLFIKSSHVIRSFTYHTQDQAVSEVVKIHISAF